MITLVSRKSELEDLLSEIIELNKQVVITKTLMLSADKIIEKINAGQRTTESYAMVNEMVSLHRGLTDLYQPLLREVQTKLETLVQKAVVWLKLKNRIVAGNFEISMLDEFFVLRNGNSITKHALERIISNNREETEFIYC